MATIEDRAVVEQILTYLGLSVDLPPITQTTLAATGPTDRSTAGAPIHAAWRHWRALAAQRHARGTACAGGPVPVWRR